jgi:Ser/Thr protein kinase RdoA (MazF antagonist)
MPRYGITPDVEAALPRFLSAWGIEPIEVDEIEEGYENQNLLVVAPAGRFVIRRYSFRNPEDIPFELEVLQACARRGFPVAKPIPDLRRDHVHMLGDLPAVLFEYVEGEHPEPGSRTDRSRIGQWLGEFHSATAGIRPGSRKPYDDFTELRRAADLRTAFDRQGYAGFLADLDAFNQLYLPGLQAVWPNLSQGIVHSDFDAGNLLVREGRLVALLDFDTAFYGALVRDVADAILCWSDPHPEFEPDPKAHEAIVAGYEQARRLTTEERAILTPTLLLACLSDAIRTISGRIRLSRAFETADECHMYCRYRKLREASRAGPRGL